MSDPSKTLDTLRPPTPSPTTSESEAAAQATRLYKFKSLLQMPIVPVTSLKKLAWNGIPDELRPMVWQILLGYLPSEASSRVETLSSKRKEYQRGVKVAFETSEGLDQAVWHQIRIDVPRTNPHLSLYQYEATQKVVYSRSQIDIRL
jgi:TBC1 domain family member 2